MNINDLKEYEKNPRKITAERFEHLKESMSRLGDLGGIVVDLNTNQVIGGNQRVKTFLQERDKWEVEIVKSYDSPMPDGTVNFGYVIKNKGTLNEQRFSYREVRWSAEQCEEANIVANKVTGFWDFDKLGNEFEIDALKKYGFSEQDLDLLPREPVVGMDNEGLTKALDTYMEGNIKQIVLFFKAEDFDGVVTRLDGAMKHFGVESHTETVLKLLEFYEHTKTKKETH